MKWHRNKENDDEILGLTTFVRSKELLKVKTDDQNFKDKVTFIFFIYICISFPFPDVIVDD